jgi:hypothetical protein
LALTLLAGMMLGVDRQACSWAATAIDLNGSVYGTILASAVVVALG